MTGVALPSVAPISLSLCAGATVSVASLVSSVPSLSLLTGLPGVTNVLSGPTSISVGVNTLSLTTTNLLGCTAVTPISVTGVALPAVAPISLSLCAGATVSLGTLTTAVPALTAADGSTRGDQRAERSYLHQRRGEHAVSDNDQPLRLYSGDAYQRDGCGPAISSTDLI